MRDRSSEKWETRYRDIARCGFEEMGGRDIATQSWGEVRFLLELGYAKNRRSEIIGGVSVNDGTQYTAREPCVGCIYPDSNKRRRAGTREYMIGSLARDGTPRSIHAVAKSAAKLFAEKRNGGVVTIAVVSAGRVGGTSSK